MALQLNWVSTNTHKQYLPFYSANLSDPYFDNLKGVYIIWYQEGSRAITVYAGQAKLGLIKDRLYDHRDDSRIQAHADKILYVACSEAAINDIDGIEKSLHDTLNPLVRDRSPDATPIAIYLPNVNLKWY